MGQAKLRKNEIQALKVQVACRLLYSDEYIELSEVLDINQKKNWMTIYKNSYSGMLKSISDKNLYEQNIRFIKATIKGEDVGFIRINDKSSYFLGAPSNSIWNITDGFVKRSHRSQGVLKRLIQFAVANLNVCMFYIEAQRYTKTMSYYSELGFTRFIPSSDGLMVWGLQSEMVRFVPGSLLAHQLNRATHHRG